MSRPFCRKCLMDGVSAEELQAKIEAYLDAMPQDLRTSPEDYEARLLLCEDCSNLSNGLCKLCGCFVLYRAGQKNNHCPDVIPRW